MLSFLTNKYITYLNSHKNHCHCPIKWSWERSFLCLFMDTWAKIQKADSLLFSFFHSLFFFRVLFVINYKEELSSNNNSIVPLLCMLSLVIRCIWHSDDLFFYLFFLTYPKCTAAPMMHLCLLFMLMRLNPTGPLPSCARCLLIKTQSAVKSLKRPLEATFDLVLWPFTF